MSEKPVQMRCSCRACQGSRAGLQSALLLSIDAVCFGTATKRGAGKAARGTFLSVQFVIVVLMRQSTKLMIFKVAPAPEWHDSTEPHPASRRTPA